MKSSVWFLGAVALAVAGSAWAFEMDERQDSAVVWMSYEPAPTRLTGTVMSGHANFMAGPDDKANSEYLYLHLDKPISMRADARPDSENGVAKHQYDLSLNVLPGMKPADLRGLVGKHVTLVGKISSGLPHAAAATELTFSVLSIDYHGR